MHFHTHKQNLPARGVVTKPNVWISLASVFEVRDVEDGESIVDVSHHGELGVVSIRWDRKGPVIHQAGDHV